MSDNFIKWGAGDSGIYYNTQLKTYSMVLSDLPPARTFNTLEDAEAWLNDYFNVAVAQTDNTDDIDNMTEGDPDEIQAT